MKDLLAILALVSLFAAETTAAQAQEPKEAVSDRQIETAVVPGSPNSPNPTSKSKRSGSPAQSGRQRHPANPEVKSFAFSRFGAERASRPLVVRIGKGDTKSTIQLQEDLAVMARILEKSAAEYRDEHEEAAGIPILTLGAGKAVRALYLEEYGAVFTLSVNLPLKPEPKPDETEEKPDNPANEEWNEARSELFGERRGPGRTEKAGLRGRRPFDQHQVDEFRDNLIDALRNASNIRNLRENDWITLVVRGRGSDLELDGQLDVVVRNTGAGREAYGPLQVGTMDDQSGEASTMVIRIKKSALDQFARQKSKPEQFKQIVTVALY